MHIHLEETRTFSAHPQRASAEPLPVAERDTESSGLIADQPTSQ